MYQKLFQITVVLLLAVVSIALLALVISALMMLSPQLMAETDGIIVIAAGLSDKQLGYIIVAASLIVAGFFLFFRRRRFRR